MTDGQIANHYGVTDVLISYYRRKWGIRTITPRQRRDADKTTPSIDDLTPSRLSELYAQMGDKTLAKLFGVAAPTIRRLRRQWGIAVISKSQRSVQVDDLSDIQKETIIGTLLGDGHLQDCGMLYVHHAYHQLDYLRATHTILHPLTHPIFYEEKEMIDGTVCFGFGWKTSQHTWLKELRGVFYPEGTKVFPDSVLTSLSPRSLAYWYFDDGTLDGVPKFALGDISPEEATRVADMVRSRFGFDAYIAEHSLKSTCKLMLFRATASDVFFPLIREYVTPDMLHKIPERYRPVGITRVSKSNTLDPKMPRDLNSRCQQWGSMDVVERDTLIGDLAIYWENEGFPYPVPKPEELSVVMSLQEDHVIQGGVIKNRHAGQSSCHAFSRHIFEATSYGSPLSPRALFDSPKDLRKALQLILDKGDVPSGSTLRSSLRFLRRSGVYNFRPTAAKVLVDRFCRPGGVVYDPCAGYGGRLFGALLSKSRPTYLACEPQTETYTRLHDLRDWMGSYLPGLPSRATFHNVPAEDFIVPDGVDMVMTSPPYWKREVYGDEQTQSSIRHPTYESWLQHFWGVVLKRATDSLRPGGWVVLNVDNFSLHGKSYDLIGDTCRIMASLGFGNPTESYRYAMPVGTNPDNHEMVLCWSKKGSIPKSDPVPPAETISRCSKCGAATRGSSMVGGVCHSCQAPPMVRNCKGCGLVFTPLRISREFHDPNCYARWRRKQHRTMVPARSTRVFRCRKCSLEWETSLPGRFKLCPSCREESHKENHTRQCLYRHCGKTFVDESPKNGFKFCTPECRRREKLFRLGVATDVSYFRPRSPD